MLTSFCKLYFPPTTQFISGRILYPTLLCVAYIVRTYQIILTEDTNLKRCQNNAFGINAKFAFHCLAIAFVLISIMVVGLLEVVWISFWLGIVNRIWQTISAYFLVNTIMRYLGDNLDRWVFVLILQYQLSDIVEGKANNPLWSQEIFHNVHLKMHSTFLIKIVLQCAVHNYLIAMRWFKCYLHISTQSV